MINSFRYSYILFIIVICLFFSPLISGKYLYFFHDLKAFYLPCKYIFADTLSQGLLLFRTKLASCGFPIHAEGQTGIFYPFNVLFFLVFPFQAAVVVSFIFHYLLGGTGIICLARKYKISPVGSAVAALCFSLSGFMITHLFHLSILTASAWVPWLFFFVFRLVERGNWRDSVILGFIVGTLGLVGHPQILFIGIVGILIYFMGLAKQLKGRKVLLQRTVQCFVSIGFGMVFAAVQIIPSLELLPFTARVQQSSLSFLLSGSFPPQHILTFIFPYLFGINTLPVRHIYQTISGTEAPYPWILGDLPMRESHVYIGIIPIILIVGLLLRSVDRRKIPFEFPVVLIGSFLLMLGKYSPLIFLWKLFPSLLTFRLPIRFLLLFTIMLSVMTGIGWDRFFEWDKKTVRKAVAFIIIFFVIFVLLIGLFHFLLTTNLSKWAPRVIERFGGIQNQFHAELYPESIEHIEGRAGKIINGILIATSLHSPIIYIPWIIILLFCFYLLLRVKYFHHKNVLMIFLFTTLVLDILHFAGPYNPLSNTNTIFSKPQTADYLDNNMSSCDRFAVLTKTRSDYKLEMNSLYGDGLYSDLLHPSYNFFVNHANIGTPSPLLFARWDDVLPELGLGFKPMNHLIRANRFIKHQTIVRMMRVKFLLTTQPLSADEWDRKYEWQGVTIYQDHRPIHTYCPKSVTFVESGDQALKKLFTPEFDPTLSLIIELPKCCKNSSNIKTMEPVDVTCVHYSDHHQVYSIDSQSNRWLFLPETYYPGWLVMQDNQQKPVYRANYLFTAIPIDSGRHTLTMDFQPFSIRFGLFLSLISLFVGSLFFFIGRSN